MRQLQTRINPNVSDTEKDQTEQMQQMVDLEKNKTAVKAIAADSYKKFDQVKFIGDGSSFKLTTGKNDPTTFLALKSYLAGPVWYVKDMENVCLTSDQVRYIYKMVGQDSIVSVEMIKQAIEDDRLDKDNDNEEEKKHT